MNHNLFKLLIITLLFSCQTGEPEDYEYKLYPVIKGEFSFFEESVFTGIPPGIKLESRILYEDRDIEGEFELINVNDLRISFDRSVYLNSNEIEAKTNVNGQNFIDIELIEIERSGGIVPDFYVIWINKELNSNFDSNIGYYTLYIEGTTMNNFEIIDSTVFKIE